MGSVTSSNTFWALVLSSVKPQPEVKQSVPSLMSSSFKDEKLKNNGYWIAEASRMHFNSQSLTCTGNNTDLAAFPRFIFSLNRNKAKS